MDHLDLPIPVSQRRRRPRIGADEVRERMFVAAREILFAQGVTLSLEDLGMDDVIARAGVPRSSAYRVWPYKGDFVTDLLLNLAGPNWMGTAAFDDGTLKVAAEVLLEHWDQLETEEGRWRVASEAMRRAVDRNFVTIVSSPEWHVYVALVATSRGTANDESKQELNRELIRAEKMFLNMMAGFYDVMLGTLGLRFTIPGVTARHIAAAGAAVVEGLALRKIMSSAVADPDAERPGAWMLSDLVNGPLPGPSADPTRTADWTLAALSFRGIVGSLVEPDPEWRFDDTQREVLQGLIATAEAAELGLPPSRRPDHQQPLT